MTVACQWLKAEARDWLESRQERRSRTAQEQG